MAASRNIVTKASRFHRTYLERARLYAAALAQAEAASDPLVEDIYRRLASHLAVDAGRTRLVESFRRSWS